MLTEGKKKSLGSPRVSKFSDFRVNVSKERSKNRV